MVQKHTTMLQFYHGMILLILQNISNLVENIILTLLSNYIHIISTSINYGETIQ